MGSDQISVLSVFFCLKLRRAAAWLDIINPSHMGCAIFGPSKTAPLANRVCIRELRHGADTLPLAAQQACTISPHSCQVYKKKDRDRVENMMNAREILRTTPTFGRPHPLSGDYALSRPLNIEIYGLKFDNILSLCLCHTSICAIELDSVTMLQNQVNRDTTGT